HDVAVERRAQAAAQDAGDAAGGKLHPDADESHGMSAPMPPAAPAGLGADAPAERLPQLLERLERERQEADELYNAALTAVDQALQRVPPMPDPPPAYDEQQITPINLAWDILPDGAPRADGSLKGRLRAFVWRLVGPPLETQKRFNAALVDHLNRNIAA